MAIVSVVREHEGISVNEDGSRHLDLDVLFAGKLKREMEFELEGLPHQIISANGFGNVKLTDGRNFYLPGGWDENHYSRKGYGEDLVQGPEMFASMLPSVISAHRDTTQEIAYVINEGDTVKFMGQMFKVGRHRFNKEHLTFTRI